MHALGGAQGQPAERVAVKVHGAPAGGANRPVSSASGSAASSAAASARSTVTGYAITASRFDQRRVAAAAVEQLRVRAAFHDAAVLEHQDQVGVADGRQPVGDHERRAARDSSSSASCTARSVSTSSALVASSSTITGGSRRIARAIARRCFSPPEKR